MTMLGYDASTGQGNAWTTTYPEPDVGGKAGAGTLGKSISAFDDAGRPTILIDERGIKTERIHDLYGRLVRSATDGTLATDYRYPDPWTIISTQGDIGTKSATASTSPPPT